MRPLAGYTDTELHDLAFAAKDLGAERRIYVKYIVESRITSVWVGGQFILYNIHRMVNGALIGELDGPSFDFQVVLEGPHDPKHIGPTQCDVVGMESEELGPSIEEFRNECMASD